MVVNEASSKGYQGKSRYLFAPEYGPDAPTYPKTLSGDGAFPALVPCCIRTNPPHRLKSIAMDWMFVSLPHPSMIFGVETLILSVTIFGGEPLDGFE